MIQPVVMSDQTSFTVRGPQTEQIECEEVSTTDMLIEQQVSVSRKSTNEYNYNGLNISMTVTTFTSRKFSAIYRIEVYSKKISPDFKAACLRFTTEFHRHVFCVCKCCIEEMRSFSLCVLISLKRLTLFIRSSIFGNIHLLLRSLFVTYKMTICKL